MRTLVQIITDYPEPYGFGVARVLSKTTTNTDSCPAESKQSDQSLNLLKQHHQYSIIILFYHVNLFFK